MRFSAGRLAFNAALALAFVLIVGCDSGCATSKPFASGVSTGVPLMERDLLHFAGNDPLRRADVEALLTATSDETKIDLNLVAVERAWTSVKAWYLPAVELMPDPDARALRRSAADRLDKLIADEKARPLRPASP